jgi:hypothetical protein
VLFEETHGAGKYPQNSELNFSLLFFFGLLFKVWRLWYANRGWQLKNLTIGTCLMSAKQGSLVRMPHRWLIVLMRFALE